MDIEVIRKIADETAAELGLKVYVCRFTNDEEGKILEIEVDKPSFINLDEITQFTDAINPKLDALEELDFPYTLKCQSADPEREITDEDITLYDGAYVEIVDNENNSYTGDLSFVDGDVQIQTSLKGRPKKWKIKKDDIKKVNLRIKI